ncbi:hypothetical protein AX17_006746 [Amanita inopinata Kibby_2008]|nr:hypothetical protein AX17_006746 [Amanita inopinata Kibby_2008]
MASTSEATASTDLAASTTNAVAAATRSQPVVFTTQTAYPLPSQKFLIPTTWKRYQLSQLVNKALSLSHVVPFDFLVRGEILRTTLAAWCAENGVGEEETLEIEYIESVLPPQKLSDFPHDDWVSSVSCQIPGHFLTSSYDGIVRVFDYSRRLTASAKLHSAPITSIATVRDPSETTSTTTEDTTLVVATASHDLTALLTRLTFDDTQMQQDTADSQKPTTRATPLAGLHLHTSPLSSMAANKQGTHLLTASWDTLIGVWDTRVPAEHEVQDVRSASSGERTKKRRKVAEDELEGMNGVSQDGTAMADSKQVKRKAPLHVMKSHTARVSRAVFGNGKNGEEGKAYSCGYDSTIRVWDVENGLCLHTITASEKPFTSLALPSPDTALAVSTDRTMVLYDLRIPTSATPPSAPTSFLHPATPSCIALPTYSSSTSASVNQIVTGAYDGIVRVWDLRSTKSAVSSFDAFGKDRDGDSKKVLSLDWNAERGVVGVGGEAGFVVWSFREDVRLEK